MRVKGIFLSFGGKRKSPARTIGRGDAAAFSYDIGLFRGFQRAMETDEVCGRPLDAFAFASNVTMGKKGLGGTDDGSARGHSMQLSPTQSRGRVKGGDFVPFHSPLQGAGTASLLRSRGNAPWVAFLCKSEQKTRKSEKHVEMRREL